MYRTIMIVACGLMLVGCKSTKPESTTPSESGNYEFASPATKTPLTAANPPRESLTDAIKAQLATKYGKPVGAVQLTIGKELATHATGTVSFTGEQGGALWFAALGKGGWLLVFDGQGIMECSLADEFAFPVTMVSACLENGKAVKRN